MFSQGFLSSGPRLSFERAHGCTFFGLLAPDALDGLEGKFKQICLLFLLRCVSTGVLAAPPEEIFGVQILPARKRSGGAIYGQNMRKRPQRPPPGTFSLHPTQPHYAPPHTCTHTYAQLGAVKHDQRAGLFFSFSFFLPSSVLLRDALRRQREEVSAQKVAIIIRPGEGKSRSFEKTQCHIAHHRCQAAELNRNMRARLWFPFLGLLGSCWCAPQQTCHPGDERLGKSR